MKFNLMFLLSAMLIFSSCSYDIEKYNIYDENYAENNAGSDDDDDDDDDDNDDAIVVSSVAELINYISQDDVNVKMTAGIYYVDNTSLMSKYDLLAHDNTLESAYAVTSETSSNVYNVTSLLNFSGSRSTFDLTDVYIYFNTKNFTTMGSVRIFLVAVSGHESELKGLQFICYGDDTEDDPYYPQDSAVTCAVHGVSNTLTDVRIESKGSYPYGYGSHYGLNDSQYELVDIHKQTTMLISGSNTHLDGCTVRARAFGHGIAIQGAQNTLIENCLVQGDVRSNDDIIDIDPLGLVALTNQHSESYLDGIMARGDMCSLSEDGIRTYANAASYSTTDTGNVTVKNTTVKHMRRGYMLEFATSATMTIDGCTSIGNIEVGFMISSNTTITNCVGDALYGPLLSNSYNRNSGYAQVELMADEPEDSRFSPDRLVEIAGSNNVIVLSNYNGEKRATELPITFGESYYYDHNGSNSPVAKSTKLTTTTGMPIVITNGSSSNTIYTNNMDVTETNAGSGNTWTLIEE